MAKTNTKRLVVEKAEIVKVNPLLECECGFNSDEAVNAIKNKTMKAAVLSYRKAVEGAQKQVWASAKAAAKMKIEARKEFGSDENLAHFLGLANKGAFNKLRRAGEFAEKAEQLGLSVTAVQELLVLEGDKYGNLKIEDHLDKIVDYTKNEVREYVSKFKKAPKNSGRPRVDSKKLESSKKLGNDENIVEGEENEQPTEEHDLAVVWVNSKEWHALEQKEKDEIVKQINELFASYNMISAVLS